MSNDNVLPFKRKAPPDDIPPLREEILPGISGDLLKLGVDLLAGWMKQVIDEKEQTKGEHK